MAGTDSVSGETVFRGGREVPPVPNRGPPFKRLSEVRWPVSERNRPLTRANAMTASEVGELLGVPTTTVHDWARRAVLPSLKLGRSRLLLRSRLEALLLGDEPLD